MKRMNNAAKCMLLLPLVFCAALLWSCKEDIDMSDRYTFKEYTAKSYLEAHLDVYSEYYKLLGEVKVSKRSSSTVLQLLSASGNFTVFAPTNEAIYLYLDTLCKKGIINAPSWEGFKNEQTLDSIRKTIVFNSVIDCGDDNEAYQSNMFPSQDNEELSFPNMNDCKISIVYGTNPDSIFINGRKDSKTHVIQDGSLLDLRNRDIKVINGYIHQVHQVVAPSTQTIADILKDYVELNNPDFSVMAQLILACGLQDTLSKVKDEVYEDMYLNGDLKDIQSSGGIGTGYLPEHRKYGFTIFAETNDFWEQTLGKPVSEITVNDVKAWVVSQQFYPEANDDNNYSNEDNVLNQFVTYHILPVRLPVNKLVIHYNEKGYYYKPASTPHTIPVYEIYTTLGKRRLLKLYEGGRRGNAPQGIFLNRFPQLANGRHDNYGETGCDADKQGLLIGTSDGVGVINGFLYPINGVLVYDENTRNNFQKQRMRYDVASLSPEFMNNDIRANYVDSRYVGMPCVNDYDYLENIKIAEGSKFCYLPGFNYTWQNMGGDEFNVTGRYEMTFTLPPVPKKGIYEIRYAVQNNSDRRGMCQVYFGSDRNRMPAIGIPLDLRIGGASPLLGWEPDEPSDDDFNATIDKKMRNNGFMKGPEYYHAGNASSATARATQTTTRRIIVRQEMEPQKTYYLKFKSVLDKEDKEFYMDYIEFCAKEVYDNPQTPEDIW